jgi:deoxyribodipyrimidine photo-lyase
MWFRRDLRLADNPALCAAAAAGEVIPVFVRDPRLFSSGGARNARVIASLASLRDDTDGALTIRSGDPAKVIPDFAAEVGARQVHVTGETTPYGRRRDGRVARGLASIGAQLMATGSPYAVTPGRVRNGSGSPYQVFTPFHKAWKSHGWPHPPSRPDIVWRTGIAGEELTAAHGAGVGELAAQQRWAEFVADDLEGYDTMRDRPDLDRTSRLSTSLKLGELHPRTVLFDLDRHPRRREAPALARFEAEIAWREFYADVLWHRPSSSWADWKGDAADLAYDNDPELIEAWCEGRTGYPFVDAGMRQLMSEGWMHNRLRMVTASFLVKDLHVWWPHGARHFMARLLDGDVASNSHGWQWVAGTGTDAAPYFRIFNPVTQGLRFDPDGDYVRRWIPELRHLPGAAVHEPWRHPGGYDGGYPERIVDHAVERQVALDRFAAVRSSR